MCWKVREEYCLSFIVMETESKNLIFAVNQITKFVPNSEGNITYRRIGVLGESWRQTSRNPKMIVKVFIKKKSQYDWF